MARWEPGASDRLRAATLELFAEQGFERTTVAEIAARAGLTERTFFRYFTDKREVLFGDQTTFERAFTDPIAAAPADTGAFAVVVGALHAMADGFFTREARPLSAQRQTVIDADPALQERELLKLAGVARAMAGALRARGVPAATATLAAESGVTVFRVTFARWLGDPTDRGFGTILDEVVVELGALAG